LHRMKIKNFGVEYFIRIIIIPLIILGFYCYFFSLISSDYLTRGVNYNFSINLLVVVLMFTVIAVLAFLIYLIINHVRNVKPEDLYEVSSIKIHIFDLILLLLPLTPVVQYVLSNHEILPALEASFVVIFFTLFSGLFIVLIPVLVGNNSSTKILVALGVAFTFTITGMAFLSDNNSWFNNGHFGTQLGFFAGAFLITYLFFTESRKKLFFLFIIVNFVINSSVQLFSKGLNNNSEDHSLIENVNKLYSVVDGRNPVMTPNIYLFVYESYVPVETMLGYGIDNSAQVEYLREQGFQIYDGTYTVGSPSIESMSRVLNASTEYYGNRRRAVSGDGVVHRIFRDLGYLNYGIFAYDWYFRGIESSYDFSFPDFENWGSYKKFIEAILVGEFRNDFLFNKQPFEEYLETKRSILNSNFNEKVFIYSHSSMPNHSRSSGVYNPEEIENYKDNLFSANLEMREDIKLISEIDPYSLIIIAGDHGPYLTKSGFGALDDFDIEDITRLDIQDRFATFLAIKWPTESYERYDDIVVLQDIFPVIFAYIYDDENILEAKIEPEILNIELIGEISVKNGIINGGIYDGEPLFFIN